MNKSQKNKLRKLVGFLIILFFILAFARPTIIIGSSMSPTIMHNEILLINHIYYRINQPSYNDLVVIKSRICNGRIIKRIIALEGDRIIIKNGVVNVNGIDLIEDFICKQEPCDYNIDMIIPEGRIYVLGDNRAVSRDSRDCNVCCICIKDIRGRAYYRVFPIGNLGRI